jgi:hypothetical protein
MRQVSRLRTKLAALIQAAFKAQFNMTVNVDGADLHPATGAWRTNVMLDVYRWEGSGYWTDHDHKGRGLMVSIDSWEPMTALVKHGRVKISPDRSCATNFEVWKL